MARIHIVSDSNAYHAGGLWQHPGVTVAHNAMAVDGRLLREGIDIGWDEAEALFIDPANAPRLIAPSISDYTAIYDRLTRDAEAVVSIHASRELSSSWQNAKTAAHAFAGRCPITVFDSQAFASAQGLLVEGALKGVEDGQSHDEIVHFLRAACERVYSVYYVESTAFLTVSGVLSPTHGLLIEMLNLKPLLTTEKGVLTAMEKVRSRAQGVDRLVEFAAEFEAVDTALIATSVTQTMDDGVILLEERLAEECPDHSFGRGGGGALLASLIGLDFIGIVVLESPSDGGGFEDDF